MNQKCPSIALVAFVLFPFVTCLKADAQVEGLVKNIRSLYSSIENGAKKSKTFSIKANDGPEEGEMTIYVQNGKLVKIYISYILGDHGGSEEYFYYSNDQLVFAYKSDSSWQFSGKQQADGNSETIDVLTQYRVYLHNGEIIRALKKEAKSANLKSLSSLIGKAENAACFDIPLLSGIQNRGSKLSQIRTSSEWKQYLLNEL